MDKDLKFNHHKWILNQYWRFEIYETVRSNFEETFGTEPLSIKTIYSDTFNLTGSVHERNKCGRPVTVMTEKNALMVICMRSLEII